MQSGTNKTYSVYKHNFWFAIIKAKSDLYVKFELIELYISCLVVNWGLTMAIKGRKSSKTPKEESADARNMCMCACIWCWHYMMMTLHESPILFTWCGAVELQCETLVCWSNGDINLGLHSSGNCLLPDGTEPLIKPVLTYHQWCRGTMAKGQFHKRHFSHQLLI